MALAVVCVYRAVFRVPARAAVCLSSVVHVLHPITLGIMLAQPVLSLLVHRLVSRAVPCRCRVVRVQVQAAVVRCLCHLAHRPLVAVAVYRLVLAAR